MKPATKSTAMMKNESWQWRLSTEEEFHGEERSLHTIRGRVRRDGRKVRATKRGHRRKRRQMPGCIFLSSFLSYPSAPFGKSINLEFSKVPKDGQAQPYRSKRAFMKSIVIDGLYHFGTPAQFRSCYCTASESPLALRERFCFVSSTSLDKPTGDEQEG
jgi:hypothetical protein